MDPATLTAIVQAIVTILTTLSGVWAIFSKQNADLERKIQSRLDNIEQQVKIGNQILSKREKSAIQDIKYPL